MLDSPSSLPIQVNEVSRRMSKPFSLSVSISSTPEEAWRKVSALFVAVVGIPDKPRHIQGAILFTDGPEQFVEASVSAAAEGTDITFFLPSASRLLPAKVLSAFFENLVWALRDAHFVAKDNFRTRQMKGAPDWRSALAAGRALPLSVISFVLAWIGVPLFMSILPSIPVGFTSGIVNGLFLCSIGFPPFLSAVGGWSALQLIRRKFRTTVGVISLAISAIALWPYVEILSRRP